MAKEDMSKLPYLYLAGDAVTILVSLFLGGYWLLNTQVAFVCSMLITMASFYAYKRSIDKRVLSSSGEEYRDETDELEDPYSLFDEDEQESKKKSKGVFKYTIKGFASGIGGAINPMRILAYALLIFAFIYLNNHKIFNPFAFFIGLSIVPIMSAGLSFTKSKQS